MKKVIREVDEKRGIVQITCADERWYMRPTTDPVSGIPTYLPVPSVTWVAGYWPKGIGFYRWLADKGWDEAEAAKQAAGDKGSRVHLAIEKILRGEEFRIDTKVADKSRSSEGNPVETELSYEELLCVQSFLAWFNEAKPETIATERTIFSEIHGYAGTVDYICRIDGVPYIIDFKTSKQVWREYELQVSAYRVAVENGENPILDEQGNMADLPGLKAAILQVGYDRNKAGWKFTEVEDAFELFKVAQQIWKREVGDNTPGFTKREFPIVLSPAAKKEAMRVPVEAPVAAAEPVPDPEFWGVKAEPIKKVRKSKKGNMKFEKMRSGAWAKAADLANGTKAKIMDEATKQASTFKDDEGNAKMQTVAKVRFEGMPEPFNISLNRATVYGLIDAFGEESKEWIGKVLTVHTEKVTVAGKRQTALYLVPEGFEVGEDDNGYVIVKRVGQKPEEKIEYPTGDDEGIDPSLVPF